MDPREAAEVVRLADEVLEERWAPLPGPATAELRARHGDIGPAVRSLLEAGEAQAAARVVGGLSGYWQAEGSVTEGRELAHTVLNRSPDEPSARWGRAWLTEGVLAFRQGDQAAALAGTRRAATSAVRAGDDVLLAEAETNLARIALRDGDAPRVLRHADRVEELAAGDLRLLTRAVHMRAWGLYTRGDVAGAMAQFARNVDNYGALGWSVEAASETANIADLAAESGDLDTARARMREALATLGVADDRYLAPSLVVSAAVLLGESGAFGAAHTLFAAADALYTAAGIVPDPGDGVSDGVRAAVLGSLDEAAATRAGARGRSMSAAEAVSTAREALAGD